MHTNYNSHHSISNQYLLNNIPQVTSIHNILQEEIRVSLNDITTLALNKFASEVQNLEQEDHQTSISHPNSIINLYANLCVHNLSEDICTEILKLNLDNNKENFIQQTQSSHSSQLSTIANSTILYNKPQLQEFITNSSSQLIDLIKIKINYTKLNLHYYKDQECDTFIQAHKALIGNINNDLQDSMDENTILQRAIPELLRLMQATLNMHSDLAHQFSSQIYINSPFNELEFHTEESDIHNQYAYPQLIAKYQKDLNSLTALSLNINSLNTNFGNMSFAPNSSPSSYSNTYFTPQPNYYSPASASQTYSPITNTNNNLPDFLQAPHYSGQQQIVLPNQNISIDISKLNDPEIRGIVEDVKNLFAIATNIESLSNTDKDIHKPSIKFVQLEKEFCLLSVKVEKDVINAINQNIQLGKYDIAKNLVFGLSNLKSIYGIQIPFMQDFMINAKPFLNKIASQFAEYNTSMHSNASVRFSSLKLNSAVSEETKYSSGINSANSLIVALSKVPEVVNFIGGSSYMLPVIILAKTMGVVANKIIMAKDHKKLDKIRTLQSDYKNLDTIMDTLERLLTDLYDNFMLANFCDSQIARIEEIQNNLAGYSPEKAHDLAKQDITYDSIISEMDNIINSKETKSSSTKLKNNLSRMTTTNKDKRKSKKLEQQIDFLKETVYLLVDKLIINIVELNANNTYSNSPIKLAQDSYDLLKSDFENLVGDKANYKLLQTMPFSYGKSEVPSQYSQIAHA